MISTTPNQRVLVDRLVQQPLRQDGHRNEAQAADRIGGTDIEELQGIGVDDRLENEQSKARAGPPAFAELDEGRLFQKNLGESLRSPYNDDQKDAEGRPGHAVFSLPGRLTRSVRLMNQTPASTKPIPVICKGSMVSFRKTAEQRQTET